MNSVHLPAVLSDALESNELFVQRYRLHSIVGQGGMGFVLAAEDTRLRRPAALKFMKPEFARSPEAREMFLREARAMAALDHDRIVRVFDVGEFRSLPFLAMELLEGESLDRLLQRGFPFTIRQTLRLGYQISAGLAEAHRAGIVHRDVKPANVVLLIPKGNVKLLDFGLARSSQLAAEWTSQQAGATSPGEGISDAVLVGTPGYLSPEQASDQPVDARSDVYSLGVLLYRILAGRLPFEASTPAEILVQQLTDSPKPFAEFSSQIPNSLSSLVDACLQREPARRPTSMELVNERLQSIYSGSQNSSTITSAASLMDLQVQPRRNRSSVKKQSSKKVLPRTLPVAGLAGAGVLGLVLLVAYAIVRTDQEPTKVRAAKAASPASKPKLADSQDRLASAKRPLMAEKVVAQEPILISDKLASNIPDALKDAFLVRTGTGEGTDTYVEDGSLEDFSRLSVLRCSRAKRSEGIPRRHTFLRFDLSDLENKKKRIRDAYLLLTYKKRFLGQEPEFRLDINALRDDSPDARWQPSGMNRIRAGATPVKIPEIDLIHVGSATGKYSGWYDGRTSLMLRHRNGKLTRSVIDDTDGLLTIAIYNSGEGEGDVEVELFSHDGGQEFSPCLAIVLDEEDSDVE
ncbi:MAG: serine/threonine-protein kinase [Planctomycetota bacterium]